MQSKYCLPIIKPNKSDVVALLSEQEGNYGYFEIWLDYVTDLDIDFIDELLAKYENSLVFVFRRKDLNEQMLNKSMRLEIFNKLANKNCYVDLDIYHQKDDLDLTKNLKLIISYHNYSETPDDNTLKNIVEDIKTHHPAIIKLSTMCNSEKDALRLIGLKRSLLELGQKHIVLGMGEEGKITRIFGALWGNELIFIPENEKDSSAPGQISRAEFDKIIGRIKQK